MDLESHEQFETLFDAAPLGIVAVDAEGAIVRTNPALERMFGYPADMLAGQPVELLIPEALRPVHRAHRREFLRAPHARPMGQGMELEGRRRDGQAFPIEVSLAHFTLEAAPITAAFVADVSERVRLARERDHLLAQERQARLAAEAAEAQLDMFVQSAPVGLGFLDTEFRFQMVNSQLLEMAGPPPAGLLGRRLGEDLPGGAAQLEPILRRVLESGEASVDREFMRRAGGEGGLERRYLIGYYPVRTAAGAALGIGVIAQDVTVRRQAEEALRLSERRFRAIFEDAPLGMILASPEGPILETNPAFQRMLGYSAEELRAIGPQGIIHPEDLVYALQIRAAQVAGQREQTTVVLRYVRKDGAVIRASVTGSFVQDATDSQFLLLVAEDVTARLVAEEARARLAAIIDSTDDAILGATLDDTIFAWNAAAERLYGYRADEIIGRPRSVIVPDDRREELRQINAAVAGGQPVAHIETTRLHKSGRLLDVALTFSPIVDAAGAVVGISAIARDIGDRKRAERALERQAALTRLLQTVAVAANQAVSVREALQTTVEAICREIGWPVGHVYLAEEGPGVALASTDIWCLDEPERFAAFRAITESLHVGAPTICRGASC